MLDLEAAPVGIGGAAGPMAAAFHAFCSQCVSGGSLSEQCSTFIAKTWPVISPARAPSAGSCSRRIAVAIDAQRAHEGRLRPQALSRVRTPNRASAQAHKTDRV